VKDPIQTLIEQYYSPEELAEMRKQERNENMEKPQRTYYNRCRLLLAKLGTVGIAQHKVLKLKFDAPTKKDETTTHWATLFLNEKNNERNRETLQTLGLRAVPDVVSYDELEKADFDGLGDNVVDLVAEQSGEYENIRFINNPKYSVKVFPEDGI